MFVLFDKGNQLLFVAYAPQDATDGTSVSNLARLLLDANRIFQLHMKSITSSNETFVLHVAVGIVGQQKIITQAAQQ